MFVIRQTRHFYAAADVRTLVLSQSCNRAMTFETRADARGWISAKENELYHQAHNEYGRPEYKVLDAARLPAYLEAYL